MNTSEEEPGSWGRGTIKIPSVLRETRGIGMGNVTGTPLVASTGVGHSKNLQPFLNQRPPLQYPPPPSKPGQRGYRRTETGPDAQRLQDPDKG